MHIYKKNLNITIIVQKLGKLQLYKFIFMLAIVFYYSPLKFQGLELNCTVLMLTRNLQF